MRFAAYSRREVGRCHDWGCLVYRAFMNEVRARGHKGDAAIRAAIETLEEDAKRALSIKTCQ